MGIIAISHMILSSAASCRVAVICLTTWTYDGDLFRGVFTYDGDLFCALDFNQKPIKLWYLRNNQLMVFACGLLLLRMRYLILDDQYA